MKILIAATNTNPPKPDANQLINKVGKYLNKNIDGAFKIQFLPMACRVTMRMYYQVPGHKELKEMHFFVDITAYSNKLRVNLTEDTPMEKTIGQVIVSPEQLNDLELLRDRVLFELEKSINKEYAEFEFVY